MPPNHLQNPNINPHQQAVQPPRKNPSSPQNKEEKREAAKINNAILENCKKRKKNLSTAWID